MPNSSIDSYKTLRVGSTARQRARGDDLSTARSAARRPWTEILPMALKWSSVLYWRFLYQ